MVGAIAVRYRSMSKNPITIMAFLATTLEVMAFPWSSKKTNTSFLAELLSHFDRPNSMLNNVNKKMQTSMDTPKINAGKTIQTRLNQIISTYLIYKKRASFYRSPSNRFRYFKIVLLRLNL